MSGRIISLHGDQHEAANALLPWYVAGTLDDEDTARFEAHLKTCSQCQADLALERKLHAAVAAAAGDIESAEDGWARLAPRLDARPRRLLVRQIGQQWRHSAPWLRWAAAAQFAALVVAGGVALWQIRPTSPPAAPAVYHTLGSAPDSPAGNVVVVFRPETSERDLRQTLRDSHARVVDGPTAADAYILHVAARDRDKALADLRQSPTIVLAEPVDAGQASGDVP